MSSRSNEPIDQGTDLAGSRPVFPAPPGNNFDRSLSIADFRAKRLIFSQLTDRGQVHVYSANCRAGARLRAQLFMPQLPHSGATIPSFAIVAQSLPYSADVDALPIEVPAGYSAVVAPRLGSLGEPITDLLTQVRYYSGSVIDTQTLVGGRAYIVVWSPENKIGKYVLQTGHAWPMRLSYWLQIPLIWWRIRGWFGRSRSAALVIAAGILTGLVFAFVLREKKQPEIASQPDDNVTCNS